MFRKLYIIINLTSYECRSKPVSKWDSDLVGFYRSINQIFWLNPLLLTSSESYADRQLQP